MSPPFANSSYKIKFHGPMVHCQPAYPNVSAIIENQISEQMKTQNNITELLNAYYAYVPDLSVPKMLVYRSIDYNSDLTAQINSGYPSREMARAILINRYRLVP
jgi:hypothetical protein